MDDFNFSVSTTDAAAPVAPVEQSAAAPVASPQNSPAAAPEVDNSSASGQAQNISDSATTAPAATPDASVNKTSEPEDLDALFARLTRGELASPDGSETANRLGLPESNDESDKLEAESHDAQAIRDEQANEAVADAEIDPLAEFLPAVLPTADEIDQRYNRIPKEARSELKKYVEEVGRFRGLLGDLGGESALGLQREIGQVLFAPNASSESADTFLNSVAEANPGLVATMATRLLELASGDDSVFANSLTARFGEDYNADRIRQLIEYDRAGLIGDESLLAESLTESDPETAQLEAKIADLERRLQQAAAPQTEGNKSEQRQQQSAADEQRQQFAQKAEKAISQSVMERIAPIAQKVGWVQDPNDAPDVAAAKKTFGDFGSAWIREQIEKQPETAALREMAAKGAAFDREGNPSRGYQIYLDRLQGKAEALFLQAARDLNPTIVKGLKQTRDARLAAPTETLEPQQQPAVSPTQPSFKQENSQSLNTQSNRASNQVPSEDLDAFWSSMIQNSVANQQMQQKLMRGR